MAKSQLTMTVFDGVTVSAGGSQESAAINLYRMKLQGYLSAQVAVSGSGTLQLTYKLSNDGNTFKTPSGASAICSGFTSSSGPDSDGNDMFVIDLGMTAKWLKLVASETGGANSVTVTVIMAGH